MPKLNEKLFILTSFALSITISASVWAASLVWDPNTDQVDGYKVYYGTSYNNVNQSIDVGDATSFNLDQLPLIKNVQYWFTVSAYNAVVESGKAPPLSYTPIDTTPSLASGDEIVIERVKDGTFFWSAMVTVSPFVTELTGRVHDIDFHPDAPQIDIFFNVSGGFGQADFNGFRFWDVNNTIADFKDVSIWSSNIIGFDESRISFNSDNIYINFEGLVFGAGNFLSLRIGD